LPRSDDGCPDGSSAYRLANSKSSASLGFPPGGHTFGPSLEVTALTELGYPFRSAPKVRTRAS
jgi:hypothetical protein